MKPVACCFLLCLLLAGCSGQDYPAEPDPMTQLQIEETERRIAATEQRLTRSFGEKMDELARAVEDRLKEIAPAAPAGPAAAAAPDTGELRSETADLQARASRIEARLDRLETELRALSAQLKQTPSFSLYEAPAAEAAAAAPAADADFFPVEILDIAGLQAVSKTHTTSRVVETDDLQRDGYGEVVRALTNEQVVVNEYAYSVRFSVRNLTPWSRQITVNAGASSLRLNLQGGEYRTNIVIDSTAGSGLRVIAGGDTRSYPVDY